MCSDRNQSLKVCMHVDLTLTLTTMTLTLTMCSIAGLPHVALTSRTSCCISREVCPAVPTHMLNPLARAVCHLSFACLLTIRPNRAFKPLTAHHWLGSANRVFTSTSRGTSGGNRQLTVVHNHTRVKAMQTQSWQYPTPLYFESKTKHTATVIILHGLGDTANGWSSFAPMLQMKLPHVKFVFPTAPTVSQSIAGVRPVIMDCCTVAPLV